MDGNRGTNCQHNECGKQEPDFKLGETESDGKFHDAQRKTWRTGINTSQVLLRKTLISDTNDAILRSALLKYNLTISIFNC